MMAVGVETTEGEPRSDTNYIRWMVRFVSLIDGVKSETRQYLKPCTDVDMARFDPPENPDKIKKL